MSSIKLPASVQGAFIDTFSRTEGVDTVHAQAMVLVNPETGEPIALSQTPLLEGALALLNAIFEKMPRIQANDRVLVELGESGALASITTVGTVSAVTQLSALGSTTVNVTKAGDGIPTHLSNAGAMHIYNNIIVS